jgi:hypothetical protein
MLRARTHPRELSPNDTAAMRLKLPTAAVEIGFGVEYKHAESKPDWQDVAYFGDRSYR